MGSRGDELAEQVAQRLGWRRVGRYLINQAALAGGVPQVALAEIDELGFFGLQPSDEEWQAYQNEVERFICHLADQGNVVIVGRGGQIVLRDRLDVLHVRVIAPLETRATQLQTERNVSSEAAYACLEESLIGRTRYLHHCYDILVDDPTLYHLVINTGLVKLSQAVNLIVQACQE